MDRGRSRKSWHPLPLLLILIVPSAMAMNDTDAVVAEGLFPVEGGPALAIQSEKVAVELYAKGLKVTRRYQIENTGPSSAACRLGTSCLLPAVSRRERLGALYDCAYQSTQVSIDGKARDFDRNIARLVDAGSHVKIQARTLEEIQECEKCKDVDICGHAWISFPVAFEPGQERAIDITHTTPEFSPRFMMYALDRLQLYTEKFWCNETVPLVEMQFRVAGIALPEDVFVPQGRNAPHSTPPSGYDKGTFIWRVRDHAPSKERYSYTVRMIHPYAVNREAILDAYRRIAAPRATGDAAGPLKVKLFCKDLLTDPTLLSYEADGYIEREIPETATPLRDTIQLLLTAELTEHERAMGMCSEFQAPVDAKRRRNFKLVGANIEGRTAHLTFEDPDFFTSGGSARTSIMISAITKTALQFQEVTEVEFKGPAHLFQP